MSFPHSHDIGAYITVLRAFANTALTAAGTGDNTAITGSILDRQAKDYPVALVLAVPFTATLAASKNLFLKTVLVEHGDDSALSDAATFATLEDATGHAIATDSGSGSTLTGCKEYSLDLTGAKRYIRIKATPDLDATGTDTAAISGEVVFGPGSQQPQ